MDRRYQVFVSSTYEDLIDERMAVMHALLQMDCMPAGMELFPAATEEQWTWIKRAIDESDYYVVIIGGRYGSIHEPSGLSYTEMEYRYACETGKPIAAFIPKDPTSLPAKKTEPGEEGRRSLAAFSAHVRQRLCKPYSSPAELAGVVTLALSKLIKDHPAPGWIRAGKLMTAYADFCKSFASWKDIRKYADKYVGEYYSYNYSWYSDEEGLGPIIRSHVEIFEEDGALWYRDLGFNCDPVVGPLHINGTGEIICVSSVPAEPNDVGVFVFYDDTEVPAKTVFGFQTVYVTLRNRQFFRAIALERHPEPERVGKVCHPAELSPRVRNHILNRRGAAFAKSLDADGTETEYLAIEFDRRVPRG